MPTKGTKNPVIQAMRQKDSSTVCIELHCKGASTEHLYGSPECSWALRMGTVVGKSELSGWKNGQVRGKTPATRPKRLAEG